MSEYAKWQFYFNIFQFALTCVVALGAWWRTREKADTAAIKTSANEIQRKLDATKTEQAETCRIHKQDTIRIDRECQLIQLNLARLPSDDKIIAIHKRLDTLVNQVSKFEGEIKGELKGMSHTLDLLQEHHLSGGK